MTFLSKSVFVSSRNLLYFPQENQGRYNINGDFKEQIIKIVPWFYFIKPFLGCFIGFNWADYVNMWSHVAPEKPKGSQTASNLVPSQLCWTVTRNSAATPGSSPRGRFLIEEVHSWLRFKLFQDPLLSSVFPQPTYTTLVPLLHSSVSHLMQERQGA